MNTELIVNCTWGAVLLGGTIWTIFLRERARTRRLQALAPTLGFSMVNGTGKASLNEFCFQTPLFDRGSRGTNRISNAMEGPAGGLRTVLFDLRYYVDSFGTIETAGRSTHRRTVAAFAAPRGELPTFCITKNGFFSRRASDRIPIAGNPEFSDRFVVIGADRTAVQTLFGPALTGFLVATQLPEKIVIEGAGPWLVLYRGNKRLRPRHWKKFLDEASTVAGEFLQHCAAFQTAKAG